MDFLPSIVTETLGSPDLLMLLAGSYLLGAIPFGYIITKIFLGYDIRGVGSGNIGMTNVIRTGGKIPGIATFICDVGKGALCVVLANLLDAPQPIVFAIAFCSVLGHTRSVFLKFKGGKGVATYVGTLVALEIRLILIFGVVWLGLFFWKKISSLSALSALFAVPAAVLLLNGGLSPIFYYTLIIWLYISLLHHQNISRLIQGKEGKLKAPDSP